MLERLLLDIQRIDTYWIVWWVILAWILIILVIREITTWFWKINKLIDTQENILSTLEDIRELLSTETDEPIEEEKEIVTEMLEKKPKNVKEEKENPLK